MATLSGDGGNNSFIAGTTYVDGVDRLSGNGGNDTIYAGAGTDTVYGGADNDLIDGGTGADTLYGDTGNDIIYSGTGASADRVYGGDGDDYIYESDFGNGGTDSIVGGAGIDTVDFTGAPSGVNVSLSSGNATVNPSGTNNNDTLVGIENIVGTASSDTISGDTAANVLSGAGGTDSVSGGAGSDTLYGGTGVDTVLGGADNDLVYGGDDGDSLYGDGGNDTIFGGLGGDSAFGGDGNDLVIGEDGVDTLFGDAGDDTLRGGIGADNLNGSQGLDLADYSDSNVAVLVNLASGTYSFGTAEGDSGAGIDGMIGSAFNDTLTGFDGFSSDPNDTYSNIIYGAAGDDAIVGLGGPDTLYGGDNNDTVQGDTGEDLLYGDAGRDSVSGGTGNDTVYGGADADTVYGGDDNDFVYGGAGLDTLYGGLGQDFVAGGDDQDLIQTSFTATLNDVLGNETVDGGAGGTDNDTLSVDITGFSWTRIDIAYTPGNDENGTITFFAADGTTVVGTLTFTDIENLVIVCFTAGTKILTERGAVAVEDLGPGDLVVTRDNGLQPLRWVGSRKLSYSELQARPELQPVRIAANALAGVGPERAMMVSPQHRVLIEGARAEMFFGESEVLVPAKHLTNLAEVTRTLPVEGVTYVHILFDRHEIVQSEGIWTESFQPAERTLGALEEAARAEVLAIFPELASDESIFPAARLSLKAHEARVLVSD